MGREQLLRPLERERSGWRAWKNLGRGGPVVAVMVILVLVLDVVVVLLGQEWRLVSGMEVEIVLGLLPLPVVKMKMTME